MNKLYRDLRYTAFVSILTIVCLLLVMGELARELGPDLFGTYSVSRRLIVLFEPVSTLCLSLAVVRYCSVAENIEEAQSILYSSIIIILLANIPIAFIGIFYSKFFSDYIYGPGNISLWYSTIINYITYSFFVMLYSWYRGVGRMSTANNWQLFSIAISPLLIAYTASEYKDIAILLNLQSLVYSIAIVKIFMELKFSSLCINEFKIISKKIIKYGSNRILGYLAQAAILGIPVIASAHYYSAKQAGYIAIGFSLIKIIEGGTEFFGRVLFPHLSKYFDNNDHLKFASQISNIINFLIFIGIYITVQLYILTPSLIEIWLGKGFYESLNTIQIILISILPYLIFVTLRTVIDAVEERAVLTPYLVVCLGLIIGLIYLSLLIGINNYGIPIASSLGIWFLGYLVIRYLLSKFSINFNFIDTLKILVNNIIIGLISFGVVMTINFDNIILKLIAIIILQLILFYFYLLLSSFINIRISKLIIDNVFIYLKKI